MKMPKTTAEHRLMTSTTRCSDTACATRSLMSTREPISPPNLCPKNSMGNLSTCMKNLADEESESRVSMRSSADCCSHVSSTVTAAEAPMHHNNGLSQEMRPPTSTSSSRMLEKAGFARPGTSNSAPQSAAKSR